MEESIRERNVSHSIEHRNSGAIIMHNCTVKLGARLEEQSYRMSVYPDVFAPVLAAWPNGYAMPTLDGEVSPDHVEAALDLLKDGLWDSETALYGEDDKLSTTLLEYHTYLLGIPGPPQRLRNALMSLFGDYNRTSREYAYTVHGDATIENIVQFNGMVRWIDPSTRPVVRHASLDVAKVMQSRLGYAGPVSAGVAEVVDNWVHELNLPPKNIEYHLVGHLIRLWNLQPKRQGWALDVITERGF